MSHWRCCLLDERSATGISRMCSSSSVSQMRLSSRAWRGLVGQALGAQALAVVAAEVAPAPPLRRLSPPPQRLGQCERVVWCERHVPSPVVARRPSGQWPKAAEAREEKRDLIRCQWWMAIVMAAKCAPSGAGEYGKQRQFQHPGKDKIG